jgi:hypothetical protein
VDHKAHLKDTRRRAIGFSLRQIAGDIKFPEAVTLNMLEHVIPQETVEAVIDNFGVQEQRLRKLPTALVLLLSVAMGASFASAGRRPVIGRALNHSFQ